MDQEIYDRTIAMLTIENDTEVTAVPDGCGRLLIENRYIYDAQGDCIIGILENEEYRELTDNEVFNLTERGFSCLHRLIPLSVLDNRLKRWLKLVGHTWTEIPCSQCSRLTKMGSSYYEITDDSQEPNWICWHCKHDE